MDNDLFGGALNTTASYLIHPKAHKYARLLRLAQMLNNWDQEVKNLRPFKSAFRDKGTRIDAFDLGAWCQPSEPCGTAACAVGFACHHPEFIAMGLHGQGSPKYGEYDAWEAAGKFFNLKGSDGPDGYFDDPHRNEAAFLFSGRHYPKGHNGPKSVARRIRYFVNGGKGRGLYAGLRGPSGKHKVS